MLERRPLQGPHRLPPPDLYAGRWLLRSHHVPPSRAPRRAQCPPSHRSPRRRDALNRSTYSYRSVPISIGYVDSAVVAGVGPAIIGNQRRPAGTGGILVVWVIPQPTVEFVIAAQLFTIEFDAQSRPFRHPDCAILIAHQTSLDDVVDQM